MIWPIVKLFLGGLWGRLWGLLSALWGLVVRYPIHAGLVASLAFSAWCWHGWGVAIKERDAIRLDLDAIKAAQAEAGKLAEEQKAQDEARYRKLAETKDDEADKLRADYARLTRNYIAANRVRRAVAGSTGATAATGQDSGARVSDGAGSEALVAVTEDDLRICSDNTARLEQAREWALGLNQ